MTESDSLSDAVQALLERRCPERLLLVGDEAAALVQAYLRSHPQAGAEALAAVEDALEPREGAPADLALVAAPLAGLPSARAAELLARLRDLGAHTTLAVLPRTGGAGWGHRDMMALGFEVLGEYQRRGEAVRLYGFQLETYKTTPDWLNNRNWANPRLFDKFRW